MGGQTTTWDKNSKLVSAGGGFFHISHVTIKPDTRNHTDTHTGLGISTELGLLIPTY